MSGASLGIQCRLGFGSSTDVLQTSGCVMQATRPVKRTAREGHGRPQGARPASYGPPKGPHEVSSYLAYASSRMRALCARTCTDDYVLLRCRDGEALTASEETASKPWGRPCPPRAFVSVERPERAIIWSTKVGAPFTKTFGVFPQSRHRTYPFENSAAKPPRTDDVRRLCPTSTSARRGEFRTPKRLRFRREGVGFRERHCADDDRRDNP
ncbi:MAG: hypothetical protein ACI9KE_002380 [Polyangiales bacterium]|jgi:hypothetical protein